MTIAAICKEAELDILPKNPEEFAVQTAVLPCEDPVSKLRVDFIFSFTDYERQALGRTKKVELNGYPVCFASCEDVIIHKMIAGRAIDEEDVKSILIRQGGKIDLGYVKEWLAKFGEMSEYADVPEKFNKLL